ncbi:MAG: hypothetical protein PWP63_1339 [Methanolobus sp.]|jgi:hypothetical protein|nr:hypothetical protein [Methanolobus sp.]
MTECEVLVGYLKTEMPAVAVHPVGTIPETVILQKYVHNMAMDAINREKFLDMDSLINAALAYYLGMVG